MTWRWRVLLLLLLLCVCFKSLSKQHYTIWISFFPSLNSRIYIWIRVNPLLRLLLHHLPMVENSLSSFLLLLWCNFGWVYFSPSQWFWLEFKCIIFCIIMHITLKSQHNFLNCWLILWTLSQIHLKRTHILLNVTFIFILVKERKLQFR